MGNVLIYFWLDLRKDVSKKVFVAPKGGQRPRRFGNRFFLGNGQGPETGLEAGGVAAMNNLF